MATSSVDEVDLNAHSHPRVWVPRAMDFLRHTLRLGAIATAGTFLAGLLVNFIGICLVRHPFIGFSESIYADAQAVATGHLQYGNPATQFVGFPYTPLFTWLLAGFIRIYWWAGWGPIVSMVAALVAIAFLVRMLWAPRARWESRLVTASFVVALSLGGLSALPILGGLPISGLYDARPDQMAWCLLVVSGTIVFRGLMSSVGLSARRKVVVGLLMAGSVLTKQTTIVPCLVVAAVALVGPQLVESGRTWAFRRWLSSTAVLVVFVGTSALVGIVLQVASHGFAFDLMLTGQLRYARITPIWQQVGTSLRLLAVPLAALVALGLCFAQSKRTHPERYQRRHVVIALSAVVVGISPIPTAVIAQAKLGGEANQLAGPVWTLTLGCAVLLLLLSPSARQWAAAAIACGVLLLSIAPFSGHIGATNLDQHVKWNRVDPFPFAVASKGVTVFDQTYPSLAVSPSHPKYPPGDVNDLLAAGYTPRWLINNLLTGRYALVAPLGEWAPGYDSDFGRYDQSVVWKINLLLQKGYAQVKDPNSSNVYYRPTSRLKHLGWFAGCFGPYQATDAGVKVRLRGRAGLVCIDRGGLNLRKAYWPASDFVVTLAQGKGEIHVRFDGTAHTLRVTPVDGNDQVSAPVSDIANPSSAVSRCLTREGASSVLTIKAASGQSRAMCKVADGGPVLDVPVSGVGSPAHVVIQVAVVDSPSLSATSVDGRAVPFTLLNPTPSDIKNL